MRTFCLRPYGFTTSGGRIIRTTPQHTHSRGSGAGGCAGNTRANSHSTNGNACRSVRGGRYRIPSRAGVRERASNGSCSRLPAVRDRMIVFLDTGNPQACTADRAMILTVQRVVCRVQVSNVAITRCLDADPDAPAGIADHVDHAITSRNDDRCLLVLPPRRSEP